MSVSTSISVREKNAILWSAFNIHCTVIDGKKFENIHILNLWNMIFWVLSSQPVFFASVSICQVDLFSEIWIKEIWRGTVCRSDTQNLCFSLNSKINFYSLDLILSVFFKCFHPIQHYGEGGYLLLELLRKKLHKGLKLWEFFRYKLSLFIQLLYLFCERNFVFEDCICVVLRLNIFLCGH